MPVPWMVIAETLAHQGPHHIKLTCLSPGAMGCLRAGRDGKGHLVVPICCHTKIITELRTPAVSGQVVDHLFLSLWPHLEQMPEALGSLVEGYQLPGGSAHHGLMFHSKLSTLCAPLD